jgi:hypothetical protein
MRIEDMTPAAQAMYLMSGGFDRDQTAKRNRKQKVNPAVERMQESLDGLAGAMERIREDRGGETVLLPDQPTLELSEPENRNEKPVVNKHDENSSLHAWLSKLPPGGKLTVTLPPEEVAATAPEEDEFDKAWAEAERQLAEEEAAKEPQPLAFSEPLLK